MGLSEKKLMREIPARVQVVAIVDHFKIFWNVEDFQQYHRTSHTFAQRKQHLGLFSPQNVMRCC